MNGQTVSANGVHVAGNFGDYDYDGTPENEMYPNWDPVLRLQMTIAMAFTALL